MKRERQNQISKTVLITLVFLLLIVVNITTIGQDIKDLTDREILIQLSERLNYLENAIDRIEINSDIVRREIISFDKRIYKNSIEIDNFSEKHSGSIARWNTLLGLFATFILGIFIWMWRKSYNNNRVKKAE